ncbi:hypothetical protein BRYFOR_05992 [Marvinbryantia formatexigens DSM 14469]|uniref:Uncharacterized protein n=1 Tax=Marvinbryantia formatexigens DSM 14469 TaxID=478749 RepID=C6LBJ7_9FIRM|nr:hypothetical protein BRYFOR_05992 [Marvinbryantia formatexigens DSM 14469]
MKKAGKKDIIKKENVWQSCVNPVPGCTFFIPANEPGAVRA